MEENKKKLPLFLFLTSLSKSLLGLFNVIYLAKLGFSVSDIVLWHFVVYIGYLFLYPLSCFIGEKYGFKKLFPVAIFIFLFCYVYLNFFVKTTLDVVIYAILFVSWTNIYWMTKYHFEFQSLKKNGKVGRKVGSFLIVSQIASLLSGIVSAFILEKFSLIILIVISSFVMFSSLVPLFFIKEEKVEKASIKEYFQVIPATTLFHLFLKQGASVIDQFFPLYLYLYVKESYSFVGIVNFLLGLASIFFTYFISKKIDQKKETYLLLSVILLCFVYLLEMNIASSLILVVVFAEGIVKQFFSIVGDSHYYALGTKISYSSYILGSRFYMNVCRIFILLIGFFLHQSLPKLMYFCIGFVVLSGFVPFLTDVKKGRNGKISCK